MFCEKCGAKLPDTAKFCGRCGSELTFGNPEPLLSSVPVVGDSKTQKKRSKVPGLVALAAVLVVLVAAGAVLGLGGDGGEAGGKAGGSKNPLSKKETVFLVTSSTTTDEEGNVTEYVYERDEEGNVLKWVAREDYADEKTEEPRTEVQEASYVYEDGLPISCTLVVSDAMDESRNGKKTAEYDYVKDVDGSVLEETVVWSDGSSEYEELDKDGRVLKREQVDGEGNTTFWSYEYDEEGNLILETYESEDSDGNSSSKTSYTYENGKLVSSEYESEGFGSTSTVYTEYDLKGNAVRETGYDGSSREIINEYDEEGRLVRSSTSEVLVDGVYVWDDGTQDDNLRDTYEKTYSYDSEGRLTEEVEVIFDESGNKADEQIYEHSYDENGNEVAFSWCWYDYESESDPKLVFSSDTTKTYEAFQVETKEDSKE